MCQNTQKNNGLSRILLRQCRTRLGKNYMNGLVVVWSGDPFEFSTQVQHVFIRGREVKEPGRQDLLIEKYRPRAR